MPHSQGEWIHHRGTGKHNHARFIICVHSNGSREFVGKVYGHQGQPAKANAALFCGAPALLKAASEVIDETDNICPPEVGYYKWKALCDAINNIEIVE